MPVRRWHPLTNFALVLAAPGRWLIWARQMGSGNSPAAVKPFRCHFPPFFVFRPYTYTTDNLHSLTHLSLVSRRDPSASRWSRCSCSPAQRRYSLAEHCIDTQCRQIINIGDDNLEQDRFRLFCSRGGKSCWTVPSEGSFLVQKARSTCLTCWLRLRVLAGWKGQAQIQTTVFGLSQTSGLVHKRRITAVSLIK